MKNVLILNRGEIAVRAIDTCKRLNLKSFVCVNDCEADTIVAKNADKTIHFSDGVNPFMSLSIISSLITQYKIEMLYPGYGFLSEDPELRKLCDSLGVIFIGPNEKSLTQLSSKKESFNFAKKSKLTSLVIDNPTINDFPLMIKASFGGGGRGNIICESIDDFSVKLSDLKKRAKELFHNEDYLLERYLPNARHIELQFVSCANKVYFLGTRDCSVQMKFQKFLEEGPSDEVSMKYFEKLYPSLEKSLLEMKYEGVGTIEFLWDKNVAYFMEVNTRIQVEHPITEILYDINLVDIQFLIALDASTKFEFKRSTKAFHAICARIYAIDINENFVPAPSKIEYLENPRYTRFDTHYLSGNHVPMLFDPLIGKLIVAGSNREDCIKKLTSALSNMNLICEASNIAFIGKLLTDEVYKNNRHSVSFIENQFIKNFSQVDLGFTQEELDFIWNHNHDFLEGDFKVYDSFRVMRLNDQLHIFRRKVPYMEKVSLNKPFWTESAGDSQNIQNSPITGKVVSVSIKDFDEIKLGQELFVLEAMKTQVTIVASSEFVIKSVLVSEGSLVTKNQRLFEISNKG